MFALLPITIASYQLHPILTMTKTKKTAAELESMILTELNAVSKCENVSMITIRRIDINARTGTNWTIGHVSYSTSLETDCERPLKRIVERLQQRFDLG